jgi:hypothetical protein
LHDAAVPKRILAILEYYKQPFEDVESNLKAGVSNTWADAAEVLLVVMARILRRQGQDFCTFEALLAAAVERTQIFPFWDILSKSAIT